MNITSYVNDESKIKLFHGRMSLKFDYSIVNADENIYKYLGANSGRPFTALIHSDDLPGFYECVEKLDEGTQHLFLRFLSIDEKYRVIYVIMNKGKNSINMEIIDVANNHKKFDSLRDTSFKCKKLMNYSNNIYFEYFYEKRMINIYEYMNERSIGHFNKNIDELYEEVTNSNRYTSKQKQEFMVLYDGLVEGKDNISSLVEGSIFGLENCVLDIRGGIIWKDSRKYIFTAVVKRIMSERTESEEKYYKTSSAVDLVTGTYNKRAISELAVDVLAQADNKRCYVIMLDIDDFKNVNDTFGHMVGDEVIIKTAEVLKRYVAERGYVGRFGGDEFFIITDKIKDEDSLVYMLKTIKKNLAWDCEEIVPGFNVTLSLGVSCYPEHGKTYDELLLVADKCLYIAKSKGKNRHTIYRPDMHGDLEDIKSDRAVAANALFEDNYHMCSVTMSIINDINDKNVSVNRCIEQIAQEFAIEGIAIYAGADYKRQYYFGEYENPIEQAYFFSDKESYELYDCNGTICINRLIGIKERWPRAYEELERQGNLGIFVVKQDDIAISYDLFERLRKWSDLDKGLLMMISKALVNKVKGA